MSWPAGMPLIPVTQDTRLMPDGSLPTTYVVHLTLSVPALVLDGVSTIIRRTIVLDGTGGAISATVPHLNHPSLSPTPVYYMVREYANGQLVRQPWQLTPAADATTLDLDALAPIAGDPGTPVAVGPRGASTLAGLDDVDTTGLADGFTLVWDATSSTWQVGAGGAGALADLTDVDLTDLADGDAMVWDATAERWVRVSLSSTYVAPTGTDDRLQVSGVDVEPAQVGAEPARGSDDNYVTDAEKLALHTHPAVIAQGATQADARTAIGAGDVTTDTVQAITGVKTLTAPVMVAAIPQPVFGPDLAPAMDAWTLAGGASWADPDLTIPAGGTISTTITVEPGAIYHIDLTKTATNGSGVQVQLGSVVALMSSHATTPIPIQSYWFGAQALTIGGGTWTATLQDVVVRKVTPAGPSASPGSSDLRSAGSSNNAMGSSAQRSLTTGSANNAMGSAAQRSLTTGSSNNALGHDAQYSLTTGNYNNAMGSAAQRSPAGNSTWATTSGQRQTSVGHESGQGSSVQVNDIVTIGYRAISAGDKGVALGSTASSAHNRSVALGYGTVTTAVDQVAVGPRDVEIQASDHGIILTSPDASRWRATIDNAGALTWTKL